MKPFASVKNDQAGITAVEGVLAVSFSVLLILGAWPFIHSIMMSMSSGEARHSVTAVSREAVNTMARAVSGSYRLFPRGTAGSAYLARVTLAGPPLLADSRLFALSQGNALPPSAAFLPDTVGNVLFFVRPARSHKFTVSDTLGNPVTFLADSYVFYLYYLTPSDRGSIQGKSAREFREWISVEYADHTRITAITDPVARTNIILQLAGKGIGAAWDTHEEDVSSAFYLFSAGIEVPAPAHQIEVASNRPLMRPVPGAAGVGFRYGVPANSSSARLPIPRFAVASGEFPAGFEVIAAGPDAARQIYFRLVAAAEGPFPEPILLEEQMVVSVSDKW